MIHPFPPTGSSATSLEKGLVLFQRIAQDRGATRLADLMSDLDLPNSTLYRLCTVLERAELIARTSRGHYDISLKLAETLSNLSARDHLVRASRPLLQSLATKCGATAHLGVMENDMVTYLIKVSAGTPDAVVAFTKENTQLEAYCSGIGKVLLAWLPEAERKAYLAGGPFVRLTSQTITDGSKLAAELESVRAEAFARDDGEIAGNLYCLAVPLWHDNEPMTVAISLSFARSLRQRIEDARYIEKLRKCADQISKKLGKR